MNGIPAIYGLILLLGNIMQWTRVDCGCKID